MTDPKKLAMSRALGAAFLSYQVEQLEELSAKPDVPDARFARTRRPSRGAAGGQRPQHSRHPTSPLHSSKFPLKTSPNVDAEHGFEREDNSQTRKDASIVVADASVLVHALGQLKEWCRSNREEIIIVPLEALNTLDLLKKGSSPLAHRARAASRILEQQVGTNPRIKVQRDEAYVPWDEITFSSDVTDAAAGDTERVCGDGAAKSSFTPEWLRRTVCCARWELDHYSAPSTDTAPRVNENFGSDRDRAWKSDESSVPDVVIAVCLEPAQLPESATSVAAAAAASPVPLPISMPQTSKFEQRCAGTLVAEWARRGKLSVFECKPTALPPHSPKPRHGGGGHHHPNGHARYLSDEEFPSWPPRQLNTNGNPRTSGQKFTGNKSKGPPPHGNKKFVAHEDEGLVDRPPATRALAMTAKHQQIRILERGMKL